MATPIPPILLVSEARKPRIGRDGSATGTHWRRDERQRARRQTLRAYCLRAGLPGLMFREGREGMNMSCSRVRSFLRSEDGPTATEYAVLLALIIVVCIVEVSNIGQTVSAIFTNVDNGLPTAL